MGNASPKSIQRSVLDWKNSVWRTRFRKRLLSWYSVNARSLPWRETRDPYLIWVSEVMLQQTQVSTVIPYFKRFRNRFPTPLKLADADEADVLKLWEGLGYYRRARQLHAAAKQIVTDHQGRFPTQYEAVLALPGIGRYTAGAILSIAMDQRLPIVEANTQRVYSRLMALRDPIADRHAKEQLWEFASKILPRVGSGQLNQASMELGASLCTARSPHCGACPLVRLCAAHQLGIESEVPGKLKTVAYESRTEYALLVRQSKTQRFFVHRVPEGRRWAGLWDFPRYGIPTASNIAQAAEQVRKDFGFGVTVETLLATLRHGVTRYRITLDAFLGSASGASEIANPHNQQWATREQLDALPLSATGRKLVDRLNRDQQELS